MDFELINEQIHGFYKKFIIWFKFICIDGRNDTPKRINHQWIALSIFN
jgi:hypothetical protein